MFVTTFVVYLLFTITKGQESLKMESDFGGIHFEKMVFFDNTTLLEDITFVDRLMAEYHQLALITHPDELLPPIIETEEFEFQMDILMIADYSMFRKFLEIYNNTEMAYTALREYLESIFDQTSTIYSRLRFLENKQIYLRLVDTIPIIRPEDCPLRFTPKHINSTFDVDDIEGFMSNFTESNESGGIEALKALHAINSWIEQYASLLPRHDHVLVITRRDLLSQRNESSTQGLAYVKAMCTGADSSSIIEDVGGLTTAAISAHEMIHSLGSFHDGSGNSSECAGSLNYLMSPSTSGNENNERFGNSFLLSQCSIDQVDEFLNSSDAKCLKKPRSQIGSNKIEKGLKIGERFDKTRQCQIAFGVDYGVCSSKDFSSRWSGDICRRLWCKNRKAHRFDSCETKAFLPMMDRTNCGYNKWCISGVCVRKQDQKIGDCIDVREDYCKKFLIEPKRKSCISKHIREICCQTCKSYTPEKRIKSDL